MTTIEFSETGLNALRSLPEEVQNTTLQRATDVKDKPFSELHSDIGYQEHYFMVETTEETYVAVCRWDRDNESVQITNIGPSNDFYIGP